MKKYSVDEMLEMDNCRGIDCDQCPFKLKGKDVKYDVWCNAHIYCRENNINDGNSGVISSKHYIKHLIKIDLIKLAMEL